MIVETLKDIAGFIVFLIAWSAKIGVGVAIFGIVWYGVHAAIYWNSWSSVGAGNQVGVALCFTVMIFVGIGLAAMAVSETRRSQLS